MSTATVNISIDPRQYAKYPTHEGHSSESSRPYDKVELPPGGRETTLGYTFINKSAPSTAVPSTTGTDGTSSASNTEGDIRVEIHHEEELKATLTNTLGKDTIDNGLHRFKLVHN